jgi:uncharacterized protein (TIGR02270 family)
MPKIIPDIVTQHAEDAAFLWLLRNAAVDAPHYSLDDLAELDDRIEAHLDGLRIAGDPGWEICKEQLAWEEAGEVFTASVIALESGSDERYDAVLEAASNSDEEARGFSSALGWRPFREAQPYINRLLDAESAALRCMGIAAAAIHRQDPGRPLVDALRDPDVMLRARALKAAGELGRTDLKQWVINASQSGDNHDACRFYGAWSAALLGHEGAGKFLRSFAENGGIHAERACRLAVRCMRRSDAIQWHKQLASQDDHLRFAVIGTGAIGDPEFVPWLIEKMEVPELARVAGEAFAFITGVDIAYEGLEGEWPEGFEAGPTEDLGDEEVSMDPDEDLPWPAPELIQAWWNEHRGRLRAGEQYFLGRPISEQALHEGLRNGFQRQRAAAALELALRQPDRPLFEVRAPGFRQQQLLASGFE